MQWENNRWVTSTFKDDPPFVLMSDGNGSLTKESVKKAFDSTVVDAGVECKDWKWRGHVSCMTVMGNHLHFNKEIGKGGISQMYGSTATGNSRDSVGVHAFECTKG